MNIEKCIAELAYFKWLKAGKPIGKDVQFWLEAESEIRKPSEEVIIEIDLD